MKGKGGDRGVEVEVEVEVEVSKHVLTVLC